MIELCIGDRPFCADASVASNYGMRFLRRSSKHSIFAGFCTVMPILSWQSTRDSVRRRIKHQTNFCAKSTWKSNPYDYEQESDRRARTPELNTVI